MAIRIKAVEPTPSVIKQILELDRKCFPQDEPMKLKDIRSGFWWFGYKDGELVSYIGFIPSILGPGVLYFKRVGVLEHARGYGLQRRLMQAGERKGRKLGWHTIVTDTTQNVPSANNIIREGYLLFNPNFPWAFPDTLYWRKSIGRRKQT